MVICVVFWQLSNHIKTAVIAEDIYIVLKNLQCRFFFFKLVKSCLITTDLISVPIVLPLKKSHIYQAGEMGKSVKCLLHRLEDLSSLVPCVALAQPWGPALGTCEQKAPGAPWPASEL